MPTIHDLPTPALLLDVDVLERNLRRMADRARSLGVRLRPHVKTHKCVEIGLAQLALGASGITVSTLAEGEAFADAGVDDVLWAYPFVPARAQRAAALADRVRLSVLVDCREAVDAAAATGAPLRVRIKVDCGYGRAGVPAASDEALELAERIAASPTLEPDGILSHSGDAYHARSPEHLRRIAAGERDAMAALAGRLRDAGLPVPEVSVGSTPSVAGIDDLSGVTEVRPGTYALYDFNQTCLGACRPEDCAATVWASVVSSRPGAARSIVDAGALALSLDLPPRHLGRATYGEIYADYRSGTLRQNARLVGLSQEHGQVSGSLPVHERIRILPNHICLAAACFDAFYVVRDEEVVDRWVIHRER